MWNFIEFYWLSTFNSACMGLHMHLGFTEKTWQPRDGLGPEAYMLFWQRATNYGEVTRQGRRPFALLRAVSGGKVTRRCTVGEVVEWGLLCRFLSVPTLSLLLFLEWESGAPLQMGNTRQVGEGPKPLPCLLLLNCLQVQILILMSKWHILVPFKYCIIVGKTYSMFIRLFYLM